MFALMMGISSYDNVIELNQASLKSGSPLVCLLIIGIVSIIYIALMIKFIVFVWRNKNDMGYTAFNETIQTVAEKVNNFTDTLGATAFGGQLFEDSGSMAR